MAADIDGRAFRRIAHLGRAAAVYGCGSYRAVLSALKQKSFMIAPIGNHNLMQLVSVKPKVLCNIL